MRKIIGVFMGGNSPEHDVSVITGTQVINGLDGNKYDVLAVYEDKKGDTYVSKNVWRAEDISKICRRQAKAELYMGGIKTLFKKYPLYCAIPCYHGGNLEGGGASYLFEKFGIPYTQSSILGGSLGMSKLMQKVVASAYNAPVLEYAKLNGKEDKMPFEECVVKPNACGSSIGVSLTKNEEEFKEAVELAFKFDSAVIAERAAKGFYELNISALKVNGEVLLSDVEMPINDGILTFDDKYLKGTKTKGMKNLMRKLPADISEEMKSAVENNARVLYEAFDLLGIVRFDFIVEKGVAYFNEVNTNPGSLSYYMWRGKGYTFDKLLDMAIEEGVKREKRRQGLITKINTGIL